MHRNNSFLNGIFKQVLNLSIWKNITYRISAIVADRLVSVVINILIARTTTNEEFGTILLIYSIGDVFMSIFDFGITMSAMFEFIKKPNQIYHQFLKLFGYKLIIILPIFVGVLFSAKIFTATDILGYVILIVLVEGLTDALQIIYCVFYVWSDFSSLLRATIISRTVQLAVLIYFVVNDFSVYYLLGSHFIHIILQVGLLLRLVVSRSKLLEHDYPSLSLLDYFKKYSMYGWNKLLIVFSTRFDQIQVSGFLSNASLSLLGVAQTFNRNLNMVGNNISIVFLSDLSDYIDDKEKFSQKLKQGLLISFIIGFFLSVGIWLFSGLVIEGFWGVRYSQSVEFAWLLAVGLPFEFINAMFGSVFNLLDKNHINLIVKAIYFLLYFTLNFIFIPLLGIRGVILVYVLVTLLQSLLMSIIYARVKK